MQLDDFNTVLDAQIDMCRLILTQKGEEYADANDRLRNFRKAAVLQGNTTAQAAHGMMAQHVVSIADMVMADDSTPMAVWDEKITHMINYLILLKAALLEGYGHREYDELLQGYRDQNSKIVTYDV